MNDQPPLRILLVDDHPLVRDGIQARLSLRPQWVVCGEADSPENALRLLEELKPDVAIVDLSLGTGNGIELVKQLANHPYSPKILVFSMYDEKLYAQRAIQAGAMGFVNKQQGSDSLIDAIERILEGRIFVSAQLSDQVLSQLLKDPDRGVKDPIEQLTERELQVFESIGRGQTVQQIADALYLSAKTVETYRDRTKRKLNLRTSAELLRYAVQWVSDHAGV